MWDEKILNVKWEDKYWCDEIESISYVIFWNCLGFLRKFVMIFLEWIIYVFNLKSLL